MWWRIYVRRQPPRLGGRPKVVPEAGLLMFHDRVEASSKEHALRGMPDGAMAYAEISGQRYPEEYEHWLRDRGLTQ